ncbi:MULTISPECIES: hypothetical protein [unclassified Streptomyces]|uniref:hypothetical protein n=1 Tax=unclassified Streptomyces TaxID=2593676 RepID=UPI0023650F7C|nr:MULTISPECIES: hypothetical protein [unclassified Streptomyces]MDF3145546.1 hypothetical protein [Streptomyces sp. T21Q-yed]WDF43555.1 hypothetical protein PBV52_45660 [Streptomyces sp. T12]
MSLAAVAIVVACISALFTGANMAVSLATYRRGRPRVYVSAYWNPYAPPRVGTRQQRGYFTVHLVNKSQAAVKVSRLYADFDRGRRCSHLVARSKCRLKIIKGEEEKEIPPFGGIEWTAQPDTARTLQVADIKRAKLTAVLTNGTMIRSKWLPKIPRPLLGPWSEAAERSGQLSFDDLQEAE